MHVNCDCENLRLRPNALAHFWTISKTPHTSVSAERNWTSCSNLSCSDTSLATLDANSLDQSHSAQLCSTELQAWKDQPDLQAAGWQMWRLLRGCQRNHTQALKGFSIKVLRNHCRLTTLASEPELKGFSKNLTAQMPDKTVVSSYEC